jgi:hypothetical protein
MHRSWLALVDIDGPFLAVAPLRRVWPNGMPDFKARNPSGYAALQTARNTFESAWERLDIDPTSETRLDGYRDARDLWVETVLRDVVGWDEMLHWGDVPGAIAYSPNHAVSVTAQACLRDASDDIGALVIVIDPVESLREVPNDGWAANPVDRLEELLRVSHVPIGIVTDGRWWALVSARQGAMPASGVVDSLTWVEEPRTRDAFLTILGRQYIVGGAEDERLPVLFEESIAAAEEITEALGVQVRSAVELLVQAFSEASAEARHRFLTEPLPDRDRDVYEGAVTVMMRTVFLLFAEERALLPTGEFFESGYGLAGELDALSAREAEEGEESLDATSLTWHRFLSTCNAVYSGASFEGLRMPAYGGSLFDPARFPWLTAVTDSGGLAVRVSDRVMIHVLRSVQLAHLKGSEARRISFRDIDVEQIGYIYEGLLGYTTVRVDQIYVGLKGTDGAEPEIPLGELEAIGKAHADPKKFAEALRKWIEVGQPAAKVQSASAIVKGMMAVPVAELVSALSQTVGVDPGLRERIKPWLGIMRTDLRGHPFVVLPGGLLVKETPSRKNAGAHYTPKSLAEEVVLYALQPLCYSPGPHQTAEESEWKLRSSEEILGLKVADIACGSGAFLVAAARYLSARLSEAWVAEYPDNAYRKDLHTRALRQVVANCLYGADINEMAVEMAKLSLWLVSLDRDLPFSFVDDKVFLGNSLLGLTDLDQLRALHIDPSRLTGQRAFDFGDVDVDAAILKAIDLRESLASEIDERDPARSAAAKRRQYEELQRVTADLRRLADGVIAAGLSSGGKSGRRLDDAYENLRQAVKRAESKTEGGKGDPTWLDHLIDGGLTPTVVTDYGKWKPLHWVIEAPDVFLDHGGFDAIIGNPPFMSGTRIAGAVGAEIRDWLVATVATGIAGRADLVVYFVLRAVQLGCATANIAVICTNSVAQGDSRVVGLERIVSSGATIFRAIRSTPWPTSGAQLEIAIVWIAAAAIDVGGVCVLDGRAISGSISSYLEVRGSTLREPVPLSENQGFAFEGCKPYGDGFLVDESTAISWIHQSARNAEVLRRYLGGSDVTDSPEFLSSRWVVDFEEMREFEAREFVAPFRHLQESVLPVRAVKNAQKYPRLVNEWWKFWNSRPNMRRAIKNLEHVIVLTIVSKALMPVRVRTGQVFNNRLVVFATEDLGVLAVLDSSVHQLWAATHSSTLESRVAYSIERAFLTFPRPKIDSALRDAGARLDSVRREIMLRRGVGLTELYNMVNSSNIREGVEEDIDRIRSAHLEVDLAVFRAYGWQDLEVRHDFHEHRSITRWSVSPEVAAEVMSRLVEENLRRADRALDQEQTGMSHTSGRQRSLQSEVLFE